MRFFTKWNGVVILAGDLNIDLLNGSKESQRRYKNILHSFSLRQHITSPTRKSKILIDHVISTIPDRFVYHDVLNTEEISDHDTPYVIFNIKKEKYKPRRVARSFLGQGRFLQIKAQIFGSSESQSYM